MSKDEQLTAWADLLTAELAWKQEREAVMMRAKLYVSAGLPLERVLDALQISRSGYFKRLAATEAARAARGGAANGGSVQASSADSHEA